MTDRRAGFTLLEVVLAMTALAMITAICYGAFHVAIRAVERGEVAVVTTQRLRVAADVMSRQIKSMHTYPVLGEDDTPYPFFFGTATSLTFVTAAGVGGGGGLRKVVYQVVDDPPRLLMSESSFFSPETLGQDPVDQPGELTAVLLEGFRGITFNYLYDEGLDEKAAPRATWNTMDDDDDEVLPVAIGIQVDGLPGMELDVTDTGGSGASIPWGQEKPVMKGVFSEDPTEGLGLDETTYDQVTDALERADEADEDDEPDDEADVDAAEEDD
jgi:prepilin-type N-terminal cleavage/methylation domain-containing protein